MKKLKAPSVLLNGGDPLDDDFAKGPAVGMTLPEFSLPDQTGRLVAYPATRAGRKGLILFHRSADW